MIELLSYPIMTIVSLDIFEIDDNKYNLVLLLVEGGNSKYEVYTSSRGDMAPITGLDQYSNINRATALDFNWRLMIRC